MMKLAILLLGCGALVACSSVPRGGGYYEDDGPHGEPRVDVANIPDAIPKVEPRSNYGNKPYSVFGQPYQPLENAQGYRERGVASWYGKKFHGRRTSSGEPYDMYTMTAAHKTLPLPCYVRVRNLQNGRSAIVRVNDRGPFLHNRLIDLSYAAAARLGIVGTGTGLVEIETVAPDGPTTAIAKKPVLEIVASAHADSESKVYPGTPRLHVQVGTFTHRDNAVSLRDRLTRAGFKPVLIHTGPGSQASTPFHRVRIGPIQSVQQGDRLVADVARHGIRDALLIVE